MVGADSIVITYRPRSEDLYQSISCQEYIFELALVIALTLLYLSKIILLPSHRVILHEAP